MSDIPCGWAPVTDPLYRSYHDTEWGVPERDSRKVWEKFQLDAFQAGLSWITILRKRESMREEFDGFDPARLARWSEKRVARALKNEKIIRSPLKIQAMIGNAKLYLDMQDAGEDYGQYIWGFVDGKPIISRLESWRRAPAKTELSEKLSKDMKKRGYKFCGPTIVYACMQAIGRVTTKSEPAPLRQVQ